MIPVIILLIVFILIAVRQIGNIKFQIWQIMLGGALAVLFTNQISVQNAIDSINLDVMLFLLRILSLYRKFISKIARVKFKLR